MADEQNEHNENLVMLSEPYIVAGRFYMLSCV